MKNKLTLTLTLAVLMLVAVGVLNESVTNRTSAQSLTALQPSLKGTSTVAEAPPVNAMAAHCFCKVTVNGNEVARQSKGGYTQPFQAEACKNYCRGIWDGNPAQRPVWAKLLPNTCGEVSVKMEAALGTMSYQTVRSEMHEGIRPAVFTCPAGQLLSKEFGGKKYCVTLTGSPTRLPDQIFPSGYLIQANRLHKILGNALKKC